MEPRAKSSVLLIYTGGTIGMKPDPETGVLAPFDFSTIYDEFPYLGKLDVELEVINLTPIDSSNVTPELWCELARLIRDNYDAYDGFVVLHGTDTMSYSASALSFMLVNLAKPVIFTGSQIPIGVLRTDGRENLITAVEIAAAREGGRAVVPEVCICFQNKLFRANRTTKHSAEQLNAFRSDNYPILAEVGVSIHYNRVVLETYGAGNAPTADWFIDAVSAAVARGVVVLNVTQCLGGSVSMEMYETGKRLGQTGVISGRDITTESAVTKMMVVLGASDDPQEVRRGLEADRCGEISD